VLHPLLLLGYTDEVKAFLEFAMSTIHPRGYMHHKYMSDMSLGSSWHPMMVDGVFELNIQEDETASVILLALEYLEHEPHIPDAFKQRLYDKLIKPATKFLAEYIDKETGLPHPSYELWEQVLVTSTYTTSLVLHVLKRSLAYSLQIQDTEHENIISDTILSIENNFSKLFSADKQYFVRGLRAVGSTHTVLDQIDSSSLFGLVAYSGIPVDSTVVYATATAAKEHLENKHSLGGFIRYPGDGYMLESHDEPGNPWHVCTLWYARYLLATGKKDEALTYIDWTTHHTTNHLLAEQIDPINGHPRGVAPLAWSHAEYLSTLIEYYRYPSA
jgi:GH15 family glucan-1,4-alpha-glucosidase